MLIFTMSLPASKKSMNGVRALGMSKRFLNHSDCAFAGSTLLGHHGTQPNPDAIKKTSAPASAASNTVFLNISADSGDPGARHSLAQLNMCVVSLLYKILYEASAENAENDDAAETRAATRSLAGMRESVLICIKRAFGV